MINEEMKKVLKFKAVYVVVILCIMINFLTIVEYSKDRDMAKDFNKIIKDNGKVETEEFIKNITLEKEEIQENLVYKYREIQGSDEEILNYVFENEFEDNKLDILRYRNIAGVLDQREIFDFEDIENINQREKISYNINNKTISKAMDSKYKFYNNRIENYEKGNEFNYLFYPGNLYNIQSKLSNLFKNMFLELLIISSAIAFYILNYEKNFQFDGSINRRSIERKEYDIREKTIYRSSIIFGLALVIATLGMFFYIYSYKNFLNIPISTMYNMEMDDILGPVSFITWKNINILTYLILVTIFGFMFSLLNIKIIIGLNYLVRDMLMATIVTYLFMVVLVFLPDYVGMNNPFIFLVDSTPIMEITNIKRIFTDGGATKLLPYGESFSMVIYYIIITIFYKISKNKYFEK